MRAALAALALGLPLVAAARGPGAGPTARASRSAGEVVAPGAGDGAVGGAGAGEARAWPALEAEGGQASDAGAALPEVAATPSTGAPADEPPSAKKVVDVTGYGMSRTQFTRARPWGLLPTNDVPQLQQLLEFNAQVKVSVKERSYLSTDVSLIGSFGGFYRGVDGAGREVALPDRASPQVQPIVSVNEFFVAHEFRPELNVLVGKKRIVWGPGLAFNPTDLLNPRRDPTDPTFQRSGVWLAQVEAPLSFATFSLVFAPTQLKQVSGLPTHFLFWPSWDQRDTQAHYQLAARAYALVWDTDVTLMVFYGNRSVDVFESKPRVGLSFSRVFFEALEVHGEALLQTGSPRDFVDPACVASLVAANLCQAQRRPFTTKAKLTEEVLRPRVLVGARWQFADDSLLSLEYLYQHDGWNQDHFQALADTLGLIPEARALGFDAANVPGASALFGGTSPDGLPVRFAFDPRGRHYAFLTFQKPRLFDDFTLQAVVIANLRDLSSIVNASLAWSTTEWLTLSLLAFAPVPGPDALATRTAQGTPVTEFGVTPFAFRAMFEARAFF
ncbi:MAG: hypothetical protein INH41_12915 [Myxococcaceae bacterium]|jgi:hypothetical protein|nr:hypothetical protein [Myxococcaceae bacterium]MCA3013285.1 hypothetical protein [Myxococcaceae bacterium]